MPCGRNKHAHATQSGQIRLGLLFGLALLFGIGFAGGAAFLHWRDRSSLPAEGERFVTLALSLAHPPHEAEVDAYFGPSSLDHRADAEAPSLDVLLSRARALQADVEAPSATPSPRRQALANQLDSFVALLDGLAHPGKQSFADEAREVYGVQLPATDAAAMQKAAAALDALLPGPGSLVQRVEDYQNRFVVPTARRKAVFERALAECRTRTLAHWRLPAQERLTVEWTDKVDAAWHRYDGNYHSTLQINPQAVAFIGSALDVACHEAYPGHHAQFSVMQADAGAQGLPVEDQVVLLRSPASVLREGAANYGVDLAFPLDDRRAFQRDVLFPLAGFNPAEAAKYAEVHRLVNELSLSVVPILRDYRDGKLSAGMAAYQLRTQALIPSPQALLGFVDQYGAYAVGYTVARDVVRDAVQARAAQFGGDRWQALRAVLDAPQGGVAGVEAAQTAGIVYAGRVAWCRSESPARSVSLN
ncbi:hypothetical protein [Solimonas marina]|uniref:DUF885 domain-containing protein n=1 Tax=Solimonas marina TaxID=2714601 RepID=A0A969WD77_9GAMM|nr:hypothetical protein [Solimonas marina]NKF24418.1 hypothetical protein [Solimonas marina]